MNRIFQVSGALSANHPTYVQRQADIDAWHAARDGEYLHIIAPRQEGKTALLKRLMAKLGELGWRCAYVNLSWLKDLRKPAWYAELGRELADGLTPGQSPVLTDQTDLRRYLLKQALPWPDHQPRIALLLDEVDGAGKAQDADGEPFSDTFFMMLRNLYIQRDDYEGTIIVILAGAVNPENLVKDPDSSPFNVGEEIGLNNFTPEQTRKLTSHLADLGLPVNKTVHQAIYEWTNGHPYLTQRICAELEKMAGSGQITTMTPTEVARVVEQVILNPVEQALNRMKSTTFIGMEYTASRLGMPKEVSLAEVERSDVYIGIFAHWYGEGITESEYRRAKEQGIPCLIYFKDENVPIIPAYMERDPSKSAKLDALKNELKAQHTVSLFTSPDSLARQVAYDLHNRFYNILTPIAYCVLRNGYHITRNT